MHLRRILVRFLNQQTRISLITFYENYEILFIYFNGFQCCRNIVEYEIITFSVSEI
jgi:hypothetical protein